MKHWAWMVLLAAAASGCVSSQDAQSSAVRMLNAVADSSLMTLVINGQTRASGYDYGVGTAYAVLGTGRAGLRIDEALPTGASAASRTLYASDQDLAVNAELTLVVLGQEASNAVEVVPIITTTRGVPIGKTRLQFVHAGFGLQPMDVYVVAPGTLPTASTPFAAALAYKAFTGQAEVTAGSAEIIVTAAGNPATVLFDSGAVYLPPEGTWLAAIIANPGADSVQHPIALSVLPGTGSSLILDKGASAQARFVNVSPGSYAIDGFINSPLVNATARQTCDPLTTEPGTVVEECAQPFGFVGPFHDVAPGTYQVKTQKAADAGVSAGSTALTMTASGAGTLVVTGLLADDATTMTTGLQVLSGTRRMAAAQLRLVNVSQGAVATVTGDPATDRLELYITAGCTPLAGRSPDFYNLAFGSDTGYRAYQPGDYQVTLARSDTATPGVAPVVLLSKRMTLAAGGIYTEFITDSVGAILPAAFLNADDNPGLQDCP